MSLIGRLVDQGIILFGEFILKSGRKSNIYCDFRKLISFPELLQELALELGKKADLSNMPRDILKIAGVPMGGLPYATCISIFFGFPSILIRDKPKDHGTCKLIEGVIDYNKDSVILIEDVITTATSLMQTYDVLMGQDIKVHSILVLLDREGGGNDLLRSMGIPLISLFTLKQFQDFFEERNRTVSLPKLPRLMANNTNRRPRLEELKSLMKEKSSNLILSVDITDSKRALTLIKQVAPFILGIKLHTDIIALEELPVFIKAIQFLKKEYNFIVLEDRKFADIASIAQKQLAIISQWADLVTAHGITGEEMIKALNDSNSVGILPIYQLSTRDNLIDVKYSWHIRGMAQEYPNVIGFISQSVVSGQKNSKLLTFSPGVNIEITSDGQGQSYRTPEVMKKNGTDIFIVGRGIYEHANPIEACKEYQLRCWK